MFNFRFFEISLFNKKIKIKIILIIFNHLFIYFKFTKAKKINETFVIKITK